MTNNLCMRAVDRIFEKAEAVYKVYSEYEVEVPQGRGTFIVKVKVKQCSEGFMFDLSHYYKGKYQQAPHTTSLCVVFGTEQEALEEANKSGIFSSWYNKTEDVSVWQKNEDY